MAEPADKAGAGSGEDKSGDEAAAAASAAAVETTSGEPEGEGGRKAVGTVEDERDARIARIAAEAASAAVKKAFEEITNAARPTAPAATPPTASRSEVVWFENEAKAIQAERARIDRTLTADGMTPQNLLDDNRLTVRQAEYYARLAAKGLQIKEHDDEARDAEETEDTPAQRKAWRLFAREHAGQDLAILRDAWVHRNKPATSAAPKGEPPPRTPSASRPDLSGRREVGAPEKKARTLTDDQWQARQKELRAKMDYKTLREETDAVRRGETIVK
jgi:hypothetical protein